jgi:hypothetical protein
MEILKNFIFSFSLRIQISGQALPTATHTHSGTKGAYFTPGAQGRDGLADPLAKGYEIAVQLFPIANRQDFPEGGFGLGGILRLDQPPSIGYAVDMGVHADSGLIVPESDHQVGGLSSDSFEGKQFLNGVGNLSSVILYNFSPEVFDSPGFDPVEAHGVDGLLNLFYGQFGKRFRRLSHPKQPSGGLPGGFVLGSQA